MRSSPGAAPEYDTGSVKATATSIRSPSPYARLAFGDETRSTTGRTVSTSMAAEPDRERGEPGGGRVAFAATPVTASVITPGPEMACMPA